MSAHLVSSALPTTADVGIIPDRMPPLTVTVERNPSTFRMKLCIACIGEKSPLIKRQSAINGALSRIGALTVSGA